MYRIPVTIWTHVSSVPLLKPRPDLTLSQLTGGLITKKKIRLEEIIFIRILS